MRSAAGWFPDPDGTPGRSRYWDGARWTRQTSLTAHPAGSPSSGTAGASRRRGRAIAVIAVVVVLALIAGVWVVTRATGRDDRDITDDPSLSTVSPGDDSDATPDPSPSATPSASASSSAGTVRPDPSGERPVSCDETRPDQLPQPAEDGRVHGGPLSYPASALTAAQPGWTGPVRESRIPYGRDAWLLYRVVDTETRPWQSSATVGVTTFDRFTGTADAATTMLQCVITSSLYLDLDVKVSSSTTRATTVDTVPAARLDAVISFDDPSLRTKGSRVWIVVVDTEPATFFFAATPKEDAGQIRQIDQMITQLRLD